MTLANIQSTHIGPATRIWQFVVILPNARIGAECNICSHVPIENDVIRERRRTAIQSRPPGPDKPKCQ